MTMTTYRLQNAQRGTLDYRDTYLINGLKITHIVYSRESRPVCY